MTGAIRDDLKRCPFCGGQAFAWASGSEQNVSCPKCYCRTDNYGPGEVARAAAIAAWNTRTALGDMTSEPRPAVEVWWAAYEEFMDPPPHMAFSKAAATVIEADREEIRAPLLAEIERLREALISSTKCLRETASRVGSMHGYWDIIFDNESILKSLGDTK